MLRVRFLRSRTLVQYPEGTLSQESWTCEHALFKQYGPRSVQVVVAMCKMWFLMQEYAGRGTTNA